MQTPTFVLTYPHLNLNSYVVSFFE